MSPSSWHPSTAVPIDDFERRLDRWARSLAANDLAPRTIAFRLTVVRAFARSSADGVDAARATRAQIEHYLASDPTWTRQTRYRYRSALKSWFDFLTSHGLRGVNPMATQGCGIKLPDPPTAWMLAIEDWVVFMRASRRPETTIYLRNYQLRRLALDLCSDSPWTLSADDLVTWLGSQDWKPETMRSYRTALSSFYRWAYRSGRVAEDPASWLPTVPVPAGVPRPAAEHVIQQALAGVHDDRVRLAILLAASCGLRRGEVVRVHSDDVAGESLRVHGKGRRTRVVPLSPRLVQALAGKQGWIFPGGIDGHLSPNYLGRLVSAALGPDASGHMLRHRFASVAYSADRDFRAVQELLGHSKPETTARYTAVPDGALRAAVNAAAL